MTTPYFATTHAFGAFDGDDGKKLCCGHVRGLLHSIMPIVTKGLVLTPAIFASVAHKKGPAATGRPLEGG